MLTRYGNKVAAFYLQLVQLKRKEENKETKYKI